MSECTHEAITSVSDSCTFVLNNCTGLSSYFDFIKFYYCDLDQSIPLIIIISILFCFLVFNFLGAIADSYLAPSLEVIAKKLNLSETIAGITLLAFAASAPDVVTGIVAGGRADTGIRVVIGGLFGACLFTITIVLAGCILGSNQIEADNAALKRDIGFLLVTVLYFFLLTTLPEITPPLAAGFFLIYAAFFGLVIWQEKKKQRKVEPAKEKLLVLEIGDSVITERDLIEEKSFSVHGLGDNKIDLRMFKEIKSDGHLQNQNRELSASALKIQFRNSLRRMHTEKHPVILAKHYSEYEKQYSKNFIDVADLHEKDREHNDNSCCESDTEETETIFSRIMRWIGIPILFMGDLTMPCFEEERWNLYMTAFTPIIGPLFVITELGFAPSLFSHWYLWIPFFSVTISLAILILVKGAKKNLAKTYPGTFATISLVVSVFWLNLISSLIVDFLTFIQVLTGLSLYFLSITILAWGNSLEDYFVNFAISKKGYGKTALGGVYGSQIFSILIGFGGGLLRLAIQSPISLDLYSFEGVDIRENMMTIFLLGAVVVMLVLTLMSAKLSRWVLGRKTVMFSLAFYGIFTVVIILMAFA